jgi:hypothetical protein
LHGHTHVMRHLLQRSRHQPLRKRNSTPQLLLSLLMSNASVLASASAYKASLLHLLPMCNVNTAAVHRFHRCTYNCFWCCPWPAVVHACGKMGGPLEPPPFPLVGGLVQAEAGRLKGSQEADDEGCRRATSHRTTRRTRKTRGECADTPGLLQLSTAWHACCLAAEHSSGR